MVCNSKVFNTWHISHRPCLVFLEHCTVYRVCNHYSLMNLMKVYDIYVLKMTDVVNLTNGFFSLSPFSYFVYETPLGKLLLDIKKCIVFHMDLRIYWNGKKKYSGCLSSFTQCSFTSDCLLCIASFCHQMNFSMSLLSLSLILMPSSFSSSPKCDPKRSPEYNVQRRCSFWFFLR